MTTRIRTFAILAPLLGFALALASPAAADKAKDRADALESYKKGLVLVQQGAWKEAEQAIRNAEKKDGDALEYKFAVAYVYLKLHRPDDAMKRYSDMYKKDPRNLRAIVGMAATYEELQNYRDAVLMWTRYVKMDLSPELRPEAERLRRGAQELFVTRYEIAENPGGGASDALSSADERELGLQEAKRLAASGIPDLDDRTIVDYVSSLCEQLVPHAKGFPRGYELFVLNSPDVQAATVPGFIFVHRGLLEVVADESQLAGVLAHEIAHSVAHHSAKKYTKLMKDEATVQTLERGQNKFTKALAWLVKAGSPLSFLSFSRDEESQADRIAVHIAYDAGFDPVGLAEMFETFESLSPSSRKRWDLMLRSHPFSIDRRNSTIEYVSLFPERSLTKMSDGFTRMKTRVKTLPPPPEPKPIASSEAGGSLR